MEYLLRIGLNVEILDLSEYYLLADHSNFRYLKIKKNEYLAFIFKNITNGIKRDKLLEQAKREGFIENSVNILIDELLRKKILDNAKFPDSYIEKFGNRKELIESVFHKRFGYEIEWFTHFEKGDLDRFCIFQRIRKAKIAIIGAGGLGSNVAVLLTALGIGELTIVDADIVEESNLVRQFFYKECDCGKTKKVTALKNFIQSFSSYTKVKTVDAYIKSSEDAQKYLKDIDIIIQTADTPRGIINQILNDYCIEMEVAVLFTSNGSIGPFYIPSVSSCYRCFEDLLRDDSNGLYDIFINALKNEPSRVSPSVGMGPWQMAYYVCHEVFQYLVDIKKVRTQNHYIKISDMGFHIEVIPFKEKVNCICQHRSIER